MTDIPPADFADLINRDPRILSDDDLDKIIGTLRSARHKFVAGNKQAGSTKALTGEKAALNKIDIEL